MNRRKALLVLEDGYYEYGYSIGSEGETFGEIIFNTSMFGYQEIFTDPSYAGQLIIMTYPQIGNYGFNSEDVESNKTQLEGLIVRELSMFDSNWRSQGNLQEYLKKSGVVGIDGVDTRALVIRLRQAGAMNAAISTEDLDPKRLVKRVKEFPSMEGRDLVKKVTTEIPYWYSEEGELRVAVLDGGIKRSILELLKKEGISAHVLPATTESQEIIRNGYHGVFVSNGPGDPAALPYMIRTIQELLGKLPIFGICLGHQLISLASGLSTYKLKFGHHGANQPVKNLLTGRVEIASENHGFAVSRRSLGLKDFTYKPGEVSMLKPEIGKTLFGEVRLTYINLNDGTIEGFEFLEIPCFCVQFHPEASPGPHDTRNLFKKYATLLKGKTDAEKN